MKRGLKRLIGYYNYTVRTFPAFFVTEKVGMPKDVSNIKSRRIIHLPKIIFVKKIYFFCKLGVMTSSVT